MTTTMTRGQAQVLRAAHDTDAKLLTRKPKYELMAIATSERAAAGYERLFGQSSKDELISEILDLRGFGIGRLNEAIHVLGHDEVPWPDCEHCQAEAAEVQPLHQWRPMPTGTGWPVTS